VKRSRILTLAVALLAAACGPPDAVEVQPLASLEQLSPEVRAGLPAIAGAWRFAGWELAPDDSANLAGELPRFGVISLATQKRDSLAGQYVVQAGRAPLFGEVRRDSVIALVGVFGPGDLRYLTGRVSRDTVWMELSSLTEPGSWPTDARAAFVRSAVASPFVRLRGALPPPPPVASIDTLPPPAGPALPPAGGAAVTVPGALPGASTPTPAPSPSPGGVTPPRRVTPAPPPRPRPEPTPQPDEEEEPEPPVPLLGDPAAADTTSDFGI
jgi:hypothetical protein